MVKYCTEECRKSDLPAHEKKCKKLKRCLDGFGWMSDQYQHQHYAQLWTIVNHARKVQDYFAFEKLAEVSNQFSREKTWGSPPSFLFAIPIEAYLNLGENDKAVELLNEWDKIDPYHIYNQCLFSHRLAIKLNQVAKTRVNPPEPFEAFRDALLESSQETFLKMAASSPIMDMIKKFINEEFVDNAQRECLSLMVHELENKEQVFDAFGAIENSAGLSKAELNESVKVKRETVFISNISNRKSDKVKYFQEYIDDQISGSDDFQCIFRFGRYYFPRHPEFQEVFQLYKEVYPLYEDMEDDESYEDIEDDENYDCNQM